MRTLSLLFVILAFACSKTETPPEAKPQTETAKPAEPAADPAAPELVLPVGPAVVELLDAGKPPLQPVRWQFSKGSKSQVAMKTELALEAEVDTQTTPRAVTPAVQYLLSIETRELSPDGTAKMQLEVSEAKVIEGSGAPAQMLGPLKRSIASTNGLRGSYEISPSGAVRDVDIDKSKVQPENLQAVDNIEQLVYWTTVPIPTEPIGLGAKWTVSRVIEEGGIRMQQVASYELTKLEASSFHADLELKKTAPTQTVRPPGVAPDESYELTRFDLEGTGKVEADFGQPVPVSSKLDSSAEMLMNTPAPAGQRRTLKVMMDTSVTMGSQN